MFDGKSQKNKGCCFKNPKIKERDVVPPSIISDHNQDNWDLEKEPNITVDANVAITSNSNCNGDDCLNVSENDNGSIETHHPAMTPIKLPSPPIVEKYSPKLSKADRKLKMKVLKEYKKLYNKISKNYNKKHKKHKLGNFKSVLKMVKVLQGTENIDYLTDADIKYLSSYMNFIATGEVFCDDYLSQSIEQEKANTNDIFEKVKNMPSGITFKTSQKSNADLYRSLAQNNDISDLDNSKFNTEYLQPLLKQKEKLYNDYNAENKEQIYFDYYMHGLAKNPNENAIDYDGNGYNRFVGQYLLNPEYKNLSIEQIKEMNSNIMAEKDGQVIAAKLKNKNLNDTEKTTLKRQYNTAYLRNTLGLLKIKNQLYAHMLQLFKNYGYLFLTRNWLDILKNVSDDIITQFKMGQDAIIFAGYAKDGTIFDVDNNIDDKRYLLLTDFCAHARTAIGSFTGSILNFKIPENLEAFKDIPFEEQAGIFRPEIIKSLYMLRGEAIALQGLGVPMDIPSGTITNSLEKSEESDFLEETYKMADLDENLHHSLTDLSNEALSKRKQKLLKPWMKEEFERFNTMPEKTTEDLKDKRKTCLDFILGLSLSYDKKGKDTSERQAVNNLKDYLFAYLYKLDKQLGDENKLAFGSARTFGRGLKLKGEEVSRNYKPVYKDWKGLGNPIKNSNIN